MTSRKENIPISLDIRGLFDSCALLEEKVAGLYFLFAELFKDMPEQAKLWRKTAEEEENHMRQFELASRLVRSVEVSPLIDPETVRNAIDMVTRLTDKVRRNPPGWQDSLKIAVNLEEKLSQIHVDNAVEYSDATINKLFKAMMANDKQHEQLLRNFLEHPDKPAA